MQSCHTFAALYDYGHNPEVRRLAFIGLESQFETRSVGPRSSTEDSFLIWKRSCDCAVAMMMMMFADVTLCPDVQWRIRRSLQPFTEDYVAMIYLAYIVYKFGELPSAPQPRTMHKVRDLFKFFSHRLRCVALLCGAAWTPRARGTAHRCKRTLILDSTFYRSISTRVLCQNNMCHLYYAFKFCMKLFTTNDIDTVKTSISANADGPRDAV